MGFRVGILSTLVILCFVSSVGGFAVFLDLAAIVIMLRLGFARLVNPKLHILCNNV